MTRPHPTSSCLCSQIAEQVGEGRLEGVVVFPVREVGDVVFAEFDGQVFAGVGVEAAPVADAVDAHQPDGEQFLALLAEFGLASFAISVFTIRCSCCAPRAPAAGGR